LIATGTSVTYVVTDRNPANTALYYRLLDSGQIVILWNNRGDAQPDPFSDR
jgi:hypothetical protein